MSEAFVHPSSFVDGDVQIGEGTKIWHFCHVMGGARIGRDCTLGQNVLVGPNVIVGDRVKIQNNVSVYEGVVLEDEVFCGPSCVFTNVDRPRAGFPTAAREYGRTIVRRGASIGANATVVCGHTVGEHAFVGAGSVVTRDVPAFALTYGNPSCVRGYVCVCGAPLEFAGNRASCRACGRAYRKEGEVVEEMAA